MTEQLLFQVNDLDIARKIVKNGMRDGISCPCCGQYCKIYPRMIHSTMAWCLIKFYRLSRELWDYFHVSKLCPDRISSGDFAKLAMWGLIEEMPKDETDTKRRTSGYWRLTHLGADFVLGSAKVPKHIYVYNDTIIDKSEETVTIRDCLSNKFDYEELMNG